MISKKFIVLTILGLSLNSVTQAGMIVKGSDGSVEKLQTPLLALQMKATVLGFAKNEYDLGMAYYEGKIVPKDSDKAAEWLLKAGKKNYAPAMFVIGKMLLTGDGVEENIPLGNQIITEAAAKGDEQALAFIEENKQQTLSKSKQVKNQQSVNQSNGMCSYQDFYIQSVGDISYAEQNGLTVEDTEEYVKGPCKLKIVYLPNSIVEIYATFYNKKENYNAYIVTKLNKSCDDGICGIAIRSNQKSDLVEYEKIVQYNSKGNNVLVNQDDYESEQYLKEKIKPNQSYCFQSMWAHSGTAFCINLEGKSVYQGRSIFE